MAGVRRFGGGHLSMRMESMEEGMGFATDKEDERWPPADHSFGAMIAFWLGVR